MSSMPQNGDLLRSGAYLGVIGTELHLIFEAG
jgi:hypothetical protein